MTKPFIVGQFIVGGRRIKDSRVVEVLAKSLNMGLWSFLQLLNQCGVQQLANWRQVHLVFGEWRPWCWRILILNFLDNPP